MSTEPVEYRVSPADANAPLPPEQPPITSWDAAIDALAEKADVRHLVTLPELGGMRVYVRPLTRAETMRIMHATTNPRTNAVDMQARDKLILIASVVEPRLSSQQYDALARTRGASVALDRLQARINELTTGVETPGPDARAASGGSDDEHDGEEGDLDVTIDANGNPTLAARRFLGRRRER